MEGEAELHAMRQQSIGQDLRTLERRTRDWLESILGESLPASEDLADLLADGAILDRVGKKVQDMYRRKHGPPLSASPSASGKRSTDSGGFRVRVLSKSGTWGTKSRWEAMSNVDSFLKVCAEVGLSDVHLCTTPDVVEKRSLKSVCQCVRTLAVRLSHLGVTTAEFEPAAPSPSVAAKAAERARAPLSGADEAKAVAPVGLVGAVVRKIDSIEKNGPVEWSGGAPMDGSVYSEGTTEEYPIIRARVSTEEDGDYADFEFGSSDGWGEGADSYGHAGAQSQFRQYQDGVVSPEDRAYGQPSQYAWNGGAPRGYQAQEPQESDAASVHSTAASVHSVRHPQSSRMSPAGSAASLTSAEAQGQGQGKLQGLEGGSARGRKAMSECGGTRARRRRPAESLQSADGATPESEEGATSSSSHNRTLRAARQGLRSRHLDGLAPDGGPGSEGSGRTRGMRTRDPSQARGGSKRGTSSSSLRSKKGPRSGPHATVLEEEGDLSKLVLMVKAHIEKLPLGAVIGGAVAATGAVGALLFLLLRPKREYKVKKGDCLIQIAQKVGKKKWQDIAEQNPDIRDPNIIHTETVLKL